MENTGKYNNLRNVAVFCGSKMGTEWEFEAAAKELGQLFVDNDIGLIYGGSIDGLMGATANTVIELGGRVIGIIPTEQIDWSERHHPSLIEHRVTIENYELDFYAFNRDELLDQLPRMAMIYVNNMADRKAVMNILSDGAIALPGGFGTADEFFEYLTNSQLYLHSPKQKKPFGLLSTLDFYEDQYKQIKKQLATGFIDQMSYDLCLYRLTPHQTLQAIHEQAVLWETSELVVAS